MLSAPLLPLVAVALLAASPSMSVQDNGDKSVSSGLALGGEIEDLCGGSKGTAQVACLAFLRGTFEGLMFGQATATGGETSFCIPEAGVPMPEIRDTFVRYVAADPDRRDQEAGMMLLESLEDRYPCPDEAEDEGGETPAASPPKDIASSHRPHALRGG